MGDIIIDADEELIGDMKKIAEGNIQNVILRNKEKYKCKKEQKTYFEKV